MVGILKPSLACVSGGASNDPVQGRHCTHSLCFHNYSKLNIGFGWLLARQNFSTTNHCLSLLSEMTTRITREAQSLLLDRVKAIVLWPSEPGTGSGSRIIAHYFWPSSPCISTGPAWAATCTLPALLDKTHRDLPWGVRVTNEKAISALGLQLILVVRSLTMHRQSRKRSPRRVASI